MSVEIVAVDVDEVLFPFMRAFLDWRVARGFGRYRMEDLVEYDLGAVCGPGSVGESIEFLNHPESLLVAPVRGATEAVAELARDRQVIAVTNRFGREQGAATENWLRKWVPGVQSVVYTTEHPGAEGIPKPLLCSRLGARWLIDDVPGNLRGLGATEGLLFGDYRWQRNRARGLRRVRNWHQVLCEVGPAPGEDGEAGRPEGRDDQAVPVSS